MGIRLCKEHGRSGTVRGLVVATLDTRAVLLQNTQTAMWDRVRCDACSVTPDDLCGADQALLANLVTEALSLRISGFFRDFLMDNTSLSLLRNDYYSVLRLLALRYVASLPKESDG